MVEHRKKMRSPEYWQDQIYMNYSISLIQKCLAEAIFAWCDIDGHHKSYEGAFELTCFVPNIFGPSSYEWELHSHCYLMHEGRHKKYYGNSRHEVMRQYAADVLNYHEEVWDYNDDD